MPDIRSASGGAQADKSASQSLRREAERRAARLPALLLEAEQIATTLSYGAHGYRRAGVGETFWQFRRYQPGDSPTAIDWRRSAKGQHVFVREQEHEAAQSLWIWSDASPSMRYGAISKARRASVLGLALAILMKRSGEHVAVLGRELPRTRRSDTIDRIAEALLPGPEDGNAQSSLPPPARIPRHARLVLISDFLAPLDELEAAIRMYRDRGVSGCLVQVLDPAEEDLSFSGRVRFEGLEGEAGITIGRVESVRDDYRKHFAAWRESLTAISRHAGWPFIVHRTDHSAQTALLAMMNAIGRSQ